MALESIVRADSTGGTEERDFASLRPKSFAEYIGQKELIENLKIAVQAARERGEPLDHLLFHGPPGLGKTTLAYVIAEEMQAEIVCTSGPALERPADLVGILTNLKRGDVLFIDEIHRLPRIVEEYIYPAMEDFEIDMVIDPGPHARTVKLELNHFTIVGATTRAGLITGPLRDRFGFSLHLEFYGVKDLQTIITRSAGILSTKITGEGSESIAFRSRGTPRIANRLLRRTRDYAQVMRRDAIDEVTAIEAMDINGVDEAGLDRLDRNYLTAIIKQYGGGPVGVSAIAATLNEERDTLIDVVEPFILARGFLNRTSRGRVATALAYRHLGFTRAGQEELPL
ncbi:MAG: Holliday junction branch migration DNA helicase RuvB [Gemmatimonadaceae bacterium 4484_173]|nr:MAG: Holliday junction branch migration DNA helicase RuvB [Gemmatimonadaceae bacterium 4484_173]RKZ03371.1 MAG: Holliday junction branch migration DNA helicase RuvB [Candidatus Fermentibacteria bacterium]